MTASRSAQYETIVIRPRKGLAPLDLKLLWQFRDLLFAFADRDIRLRYRQTALGAAWVILQPLLGASIFAIVFGVIAKMPSDGTPYFLISYTGFLGWSLFQGVISRVTPSLVANASLIRKVFFPRLLVPLGVIPSVVLDFVVSLLVLVVLMVIYRITPNWGLALVPLAILILLGLALGFGLAATSLAVRFRDVQHVAPFAVSLFMYASPVGYAVAAVPEHLRHLYLLLNPMAAPIDVIRWAFLGTEQPQFAYLATSALAAVLSVVVGLLVFHSAEREFADVI
ncbi:MAG: ABC transporter permease [Phenylobacterium sp.]|jgi:lipopolysaccharide transport system permease protein